MSMNTISYIELSKIAPKIDTLNKIAQRLNIELYELFIDNIKIPILNKMQKANQKDINKINKIIDIIID